MKTFAPDPQPLIELVAEFKYKPGWTAQLVDEPEGEDGAGGYQLWITSLTVHSYAPERKRTTIFPFIVPAATFNRQSWRRWLFERVLEAERHEACEFFQIGDERPFAPHHGPGEDPYIVFEIGTELATRTLQDGSISE